MAWDDKLARPLPLADGRLLTTLREVAQLFIDHFGGVIYSAPIEDAVKLLLAAAESGKSEDIKNATDQAERVLRDRQLMR